jgi:hypothetical protein
MVRFRRRKSPDDGETNPKSLRESSRIPSTTDKGGKIPSPINGAPRRYESEMVDAAPDRRSSRSNGSRKRVAPIYEVKSRSEISRIPSKGPSLSGVSRQTYGMSNAVHKSKEFQENPQSVVSGGYESSYNVSANQYDMEEEDDHWQNDAGEEGEVGGEKRGGEY